LDNYLAAFQRERTNFDGNLGQLLTFRSLGGGVAAGFNGLCNLDIKERLSVSMIENTNPQNIPVYSWSVFVITHEFGHLLGSRHTNACVWGPNSNAAIDGCAPTEGGCQPPIPAIPADGGTIMSNCWPRSNFFVVGFGEQPGNLIRHRVSQATCLGTVITGPTTFCNTATYSSIYSNLLAFWDASPGFFADPVPWHLSTSATVTAYGSNNQTGVLSAWVPGFAYPILTKTIQRVCPTLPCGCMHGSCVCPVLPPPCNCPEGQCSCELFDCPMCGGVPPGCSWCSPSPVLAFPNPVSDVLFVDVGQQTKSRISCNHTHSCSCSPPDITYDIRLLDAQGIVVRQQQAKTGTVEFNVFNLPEGTYYLHIYDGVSKQPYMYQVIVER